LITARACLSILAALLFAGATIASAEEATGGGFRATFTGSLSPTALPRDHLAPVALRLHARIRPLPGAHAPRLRRLRIEVNHHAQLSVRGLSTCPISSLRALSTSSAYRRCRDSLVGEGKFFAHIDVPDQAPFPSEGRLLAFYSRYRGHPALLGHVFGTEPARTVIVLPITISRSAKGGFATTFSALMPEVGEEWGYVSGLDLTISRRYRYHGRQHSFISASCPAPLDVHRAPFIAARGTYFLADGRVVQRLLASNCIPAD
jgi:hypothetical protein